jgi:hypothetical protein
MVRERKQKYLMFFRLFGEGTLYHQWTTTGEFWKEGHHRQAEQKKWRRRRRRSWRKI